MSEIDYDKLLDYWANKLYEKADTLNQKENESETGSYQYGYYKGAQSAIYEAMALLSLLETRKKNMFIKGDS